MIMVVHCSISTLIRLCRPRPGYTIAKVQVSHSTAHHHPCEPQQHHDHNPCDHHKHHDHHSCHHHHDQDGDIDLGKLAENSNYHTTGATLHPRFVISISISISVIISITMISISIINTKSITIIIKENIMIRFSIMIVISTVLIILFRLELLEYPRNDIIYIRDIGQGQFGRVFQVILS